MLASNNPSTYNDRSLLYLKESSKLSLARTSYRRTALSLTKMTKFTADKLEQVVDNRSFRLNTQHSDLDVHQSLGINRSLSVADSPRALIFRQISEHSSWKLPANQRSIEGKGLQSRLQTSASTGILNLSRPKIQSQCYLSRYNSVKAKQYSKLVDRQKIVSINRRLLDQSVKECSVSPSAKVWSSPFVRSSPDKEGQQLVSSKIVSPFPKNTDPTALKVLNLDRLFRLQGGKLTNIVPLPTVKLGAVTARQNMNKVIGSKQPISLLIKEYERLLKLTRLLKTPKKVGIRGKNCQCKPTFQDILRIKLTPRKKDTPSQTQNISVQVFIQHCSFYTGYLKQHHLITPRLLAGLTEGEDGLNFSALSNLYELFVSRTASQSIKKNFLLYFLVPRPRISVPREELDGLLAVLCIDLPSIGILQSAPSTLTNDEKALIFKQALVRVLFSDSDQPLDRQQLQEAFTGHPEAADLLLALLLVKPSF